MLFFQVLLPVFLIILAGFTLEKTLRPDFRTLTDCSLYLFTPALVFSSLMRQELRLDLAGNLFLFMLLYTATMLALSMAIARLLRFDADTRSALALTTVVMNVGNYGLPLAYFAFGDAGLKVSILTFVMFNIPLGTLAIVLAQGNRAPLGQALRNTLRIPIFHGVLLAMLFKAFGWHLPDTLLRPCELLGQAAIPLMLVLLGMQLARTTHFGQPGFLTLSAALRLVVAPLVAWLLTALLGFQGLTRDVVILQTSTPSAVLPLLYAVRFGTRPDLVASAIFVTTLLSAATLTVLLYLLH
jgi:malate permease and related proteins